VSTTIKDVARVAQVSVATVSRALNGHHNVTAEVRRRVAEAAAQLRYVPHAAARSLSSRRTQTLGVVLPDLHGEFFSELLRGIDGAARASGLHVLLSSYNGHPEEQGEALRTLRGRVDGLLVMSPFAIPGDVPAEPMALALPIVRLNSSRLHAGDRISVDNYGGARTMMRHLLDGGHRRIAFIAGPAWNVDAHERQRGYLDAIAEAGQEPRVLPGDFEGASGFAAGEALLASPRRPDAVFAANDMMALGCQLAFARAGAVGPGAIALAGFDDVPLARLMHPALTTMRVDIAGFGDAATRVLVARLAGDASPPVERVLAPELVVRASSLAG
jgi:LacI family transcriptional regulator